MIEHPETLQPKKWYSDAILIKLSIITVLVLALLIPSSWIQSMIDEREASEQAMRNDIASKWSGNQLIQGPVLVLPYKKAVNDKRIEYAYILPETLGIKADVKTELFHQGIIDATEYNSKIALQGSFLKPDFNKLEIDPNLVMYDKARLVFSISDLKGLKSNPVVRVQDQQLSPEPTYGDGTPFDKGLQVTFNLQPDAGFNFSYDLDIKGTDDLSFVHLGKTTDVEVNSDWKSPLFSGKHLPDSRKITDKGFSAKWRMSYYRRPFQQQWVGNDTLLTTRSLATDATFGVKFSLPVDQYRKTTRTTRYSTLIILLTFVSLFLTELIRKQKVHVFNYVLIGAAMVIYYTLLLSFAEHFGYDTAYLISSVSTITLISWFTASLLGNKNIALLFGAILTTFYGFIYVLIQLEELSLMIGSIALFIIITVLMYFSRKINWEKH